MQDLNAQRAVTFLCVCLCVCVKWMAKGRGCHYPVLNEVSYGLYPDLALVKGAAFPNNFHRYGTINTEGPDTKRAPAHGAITPSFTVSAKRNALDKREKKNEGKKSQHKQNKGSSNCKKKRSPLAM